MNPMRLLPLVTLCLVPALTSLVSGADALPSKSTYAKSYGATKNAVTVDPAKDLPRYPAVAPEQAIDTWQVKKGFKLELAAHEPQVRDPIAICFDENGRMFVCEMIDYSEMRDMTPHLGRVSMLEDKDADGHFETSTVFADDLPWPTGLIWANGSLFVGATPDLWRFEDKDGDGKAEVREKVFTGFGTGLKMLNVQGLMNSFQWGQDNRVHILAGGGNRGKIKCLKRADLPEQELGGQDFWFDPVSFEFGLEGGGAQYGMSFDNYGRKFGCSNSDHLQYWLYDAQYAGRNPAFDMPAPRQSIAVDGGAAEVFRISPDEPWRIIRTRWRIAGVVKGVVEGGGRVSGYFTGATGTMIYRGDAYGPEFLNNSFSGDAGGQLVHRKIIRYAENGIDLLGERPGDERSFEFAASKDTWVRVVNFANAPDGCLHVCDMYREVIEHPWSIPDEIKKYIDLNSGNDRGRIYRIVPVDFANRRGTKVMLGKATASELVKTLGHANGWHRDTAARLLYERQDKEAVTLLNAAVESGEEPLARLHGLHALDGLKALSEDVLIHALADSDPFVREHALRLTEKRFASSAPSAALTTALSRLASDKDARVRFQAALTLPSFVKTADSPLLAALVELAKSDDARIADALASAPPDTALWLFDKVASDGNSEGSAAVLERLVEVAGAAAKGEKLAAVIRHLVARGSHPALIRAFAQGLRRAGMTIAKADAAGQLGAVFTQAAATAASKEAGDAKRLQAIDLLGLADFDSAATPLQACLDANTSVQTAAVRALAQFSAKKATQILLAAWSDLKPQAREAAMTAFLGREDRSLALLESMSSDDAGAVRPADLGAPQVQALINHKDAKVAMLAKTVLKLVIPPSREEVAKTFAAAVTTKGDGAKGQIQFAARCIACHRAAGLGLAVGPDLITVKTKGRDALLTAILDPHKEVASQFIAYTVNTKDGQTLTGIITKDDASSLSVKMMGGVEITVQRANVKGSSSSGQSLMPEGLEAGMSVADMADLLTFIEQLK